MRALLLAILLVANVASAQSIRSPGSGSGGLDLSEAYGRRTVGFAQPQGFESTAINEQFGLFLSTTGTVTSVTYAATAYGRYQRYRISSNTTANNAAIFGVTAQPAGRGQFQIDGSNFIAFTHIGIPVGYLTGTRGFFGVLASNAALAGATNPSTLTNTIYFGWDSGQTTWRVCSNDAAGTATCSDLGLPITTTGMFHFEFRQALNGSTVSYRMRRMDAAGTDFIGVISSDLPTSTQPLRQSNMASVGTASGTAVIIEPKYVYLETP